MENDQQDDVAEPNYELQMKLDAQAIAEGIRANIQAMFPRAEVTVSHCGGAVLPDENMAERDGPHPALGSLQEPLSHVYPQIELALTELRKDPENLG